MAVHFGIVLLLLFTIAYFFGWLVTIQKHNFFKFRGIAFLKPVIFFGNFYSAFIELDHPERLVNYFYTYFRSEKIFGIFNFFRPTIMVKDLNLAKKITIDYFDNFKERDSYDIDHVLNKSLFNQTGENRKIMRNLMEDFLSNEDFKNWHRDQNVLNSQSLVEQLLNDNKAMKDINITFNFQLYLVNIYHDIIFGSKSPKNEDKVILLKMMKQVEKDMTSIEGKMKIIFLTYFPKISKLFRLKIINSTVYESFIDYANKEMKDCTCHVDKIGLLNYLDKNKNLFPNEDNEIILQIFAFFIDGFFLTSKLFQVCCFELGRNENIQDELRKSSFNYNQFNESKILISFILETLRKWPLINNINRVCNQNCTVETKNGEKLKFYTGDFIKIPIIHMNNDFKYFFDPIAFDINRFSERNEPILSFGFGSRAYFCSELALEQMNSVLFKIIQSFKIYGTANNYDYTPTQFNELELDIKLHSLTKEL